jgi:hypothetical protein
MSFCFIAAALMSVCLAGVSGKAHAGIIPYSVIGPHEFQLPVGDNIPKNGLPILLSYNTWRDEGKAWDGESGARSTFANINKLAYVFKFDSLPKVGFLWEGLAGFASATSKADTSVTGMIDAQTGILAWFKPAGNLVTGLEYWMYLPVGDNELSGHSWNHSFAFVANYALGNFTFDGDFGVKIMGDYKNGGVHAEQGDVFFANLVFAYKFMKNIEPFVKYDYQDAGPGKDKATSVKTSGNSEMAYGVGNHFSLTDKLSADLWYEHGFTGRNTTKTNAGYFKVCYVF